MENPHDFFLITPSRPTCFLIDSGISACFFQYHLKFHVLNSPYLIFLNRVAIEICLASIILKEIRGGWIRKYQVLLFFYVEAIKNNWFFERQWWGGLKCRSISEANLCRGSQNIFHKTFLKNFVKFTEKNLCQSLFFKTFCHFKRRHWHKCFPLNSEIF